MKRTVLALFGMIALTLNATAQQDMASQLGDARAIFLGGPETDSGAAAAQVRARIFDNLAGRWARVDALGEDAAELLGVVCERQGAELTVREPFQFSLEFNAETDRAYKVEYANRQGSSFVQFAEQEGLFANFGIDPNTDAGLQILGSVLPEQNGVVNIVRYSEDVLVMISDNSAARILARCPAP